jgi:hypothetical protein
LCAAPCARLDAIQPSQTIDVKRPRGLRGLFAFWVRLPALPDQVGQTEVP